MKKHNFKIGDRVKVTYMDSKYKGSSAWEDLGKVGKIIEIWEGEGSEWPIRVKIADDYEAGFSEDEIEPAVKVGEQLLFNFMKED